MKKIIIMVIMLVCFSFVSCTSVDTEVADIEKTENGNNDDIIIDDNESDENNNEEDSMEIKYMYIKINNGNSIEVTLTNNSSVDALVNILKTNDITYTATDYGDFEKVGNIGHNLPQNNTQTTTSPGDVILYTGNNICLYYGINSWNFTRIGKVNGYTNQEYRDLFHAGTGSVSITISLNK